jgi:hypothetical protein
MKNPHKSNAKHDLFFYCETVKFYYISELHQGDKVVKEEESQE